MSKYTKPDFPSSEKIENIFYAFGFVIPTTNDGRRIWSPKFKNFIFDQYKIYLAPQPVDFRKGMDGLAAIVQFEFELDPFCGAVFISRSKRSDRMKAILWDGSGLILIYKRIEGSGFVWPSFRDGTISISKTQFEALFEGIDWRRVSSCKVVKPQA